MSFWQSMLVKSAKKDHRCLYCGRTIKQGESYYREAGTFEGEFQHYKLCLRCEYVISKYEEPGEFLSDFYEILSDCGLILCPSCGGYRMDRDFSEDKMSCECECDKCGEKWTANLSLEGIKALEEATK